MTSPKVNSEGQKQLAKAQEQLENFEAQVKAITPDPLGKLPVQETEPQTKLSTREIDKTDGYYLKPIRTISCKEKFNEAYRSDYEYAKEYVRFIAEHKEIIGDSIDIWTKPFAGISAEEWMVPTNRVVIGPRYLAEQIARKSYTRLRMEDTKTAGSDGMGTYYGQIVADAKIQRLDAKPAAGFHKRASNF